MTYTWRHQQPGDGRPGLVKAVQVVIASPHDCVTDTKAGHCYHWSLVITHKVMVTRYPRIGTGKPGSIASKIYRQQRISQTTRHTRHKQTREKNKTRTQTDSRTSSDRSELIDPTDIETNSDILRNFNNLDGFNTQQVIPRSSDNELQGNMRESYRPSKPNHYVPFDPRESPRSPRQDRRHSQAWSDSSQHEASNYNSDTSTVSKHRPARALLNASHIQTDENSSDRSKQYLALWSCVIIFSIIILLIIIAVIIYYLSVGGE